MPSYLPAIVAHHRSLAAGDRRDVGRLTEQAAALGPTRGFRAAVAAGANLSVVAEIKRRSPSKGALAPGLDPADLAARYQTGGAACLSVLTDETFFGGSVTDFETARAAVSLPVLRKDFTVAPVDVVDARLMGADAVLLIVAALDHRELEGLLALARRLGLDALVEVHDRPELERALGAGSDLIGINQRDLRSFEVHRGRAVDLVASVPAGVVAVAESGIGSADDARALADAGFEGILVGETLVTAQCPEEVVAGLARPRVASRAVGDPVR